MSQVTKVERRGRPRNFDPDTAVLQAMTLFLDRGYDNVGIAQICRELGITPPSLYAAFGSKLGLYTRAVTSYLSGNGAFIESSLRRATTVRQVWTNMLYGSAEAVTRGKTPGCLVFDGQIATVDPGVKRLLNQHVNAARQAIQDRLSELGDRDARASSLTILTLLRGFSAAARAGATQSDLKGIADLALAGVGIAKATQDQDA